VSSQSQDLVLAAGVRTPWARAGGAFAREDAGHLGALVTRELLARTGIRGQDGGGIAELIAGCVGPPHDQANVARVIALRAGLPQAMPARTVARNCASGMESVSCAISALRAGEGEAFLCLGVEVMSRYPLVMNDALTGFFDSLSRARTPLAKLRSIARFRPAMLAPRIALLEGLTDPVSGLIMGRTAEILAREQSITREAADQYALESHRRALTARTSGRFARELVPVLPQGARPGARPGPQPGPQPGAQALAEDDAIRADQSLTALAKLKPYFEKPDGRVTVGNSCGITDGACALLVSTRAKAQSLGLKPLARIVAHAWTGCDPARMGLGPVYASREALRRADLSWKDMDVVEINEAFAAQVLACLRLLPELDPARVNVNGGAIALGHPVGATGSRLLLTLAHELHERRARYGLASLCIGGGQGGAFILERCES
jgi:acetyl-CoA C-acetyltransferase/acetyl-CoA acyltransferase